MTEGVTAAPAGGGGGYHRSVASIPSRRSLDVQLGPAAHTGDYDEQPDGQHSMRSWTSVEPLATSQRSPRRRLQQQQNPQQHHQLHRQQQRVRWSRMASTAAAAEPQPASMSLVAAASAAASTASTSASAGLCQLVDFGETRDLIRRHREAEKKLAEVNSIVSHLSLEKENSQNPHQLVGWATFRQQTNSQFKQYVFQSPGRAPLLPTVETSDSAAPGASAPSQQQRQQREHLQRSRTTLGLVAGRTAARHSRPEPLGAAAFRRELTMTTAAAPDRESSSLSGMPHHHHRMQAHYKGQGHSSNTFITDPDGFYGQFERMKSKNVRLD